MGYTRRELVGICRWERLHESNTRWEQLKKMYKESQKTLPVFTNQDATSSRKMQSLRKLHHQEYYLLVGHHQREYNRHHRKNLAQFKVKKSYWNLLLDIFHMAQHLTITGGV